MLCQHLERGIQTYVCPGESERYGWKTRYFLSCSNSEALENKQEETCPNTSLLPCGTKGSCPGTGSTHTPTEARAEASLLLRAHQKESSDWKGFMNTRPGQQTCQTAVNKHRIKGSCATAAQFAAGDISHSLPPSLPVSPGESAASSCSWTQKAVRDVR